MKTITLDINGETVEARVEPRTSLGDFLRDERNLTGTHLSCEHGVCGACTVLLDGAPVRACITRAVQCEGAAVRTVEGFDGDPLMDKLREAFHREHALQCGFCTPGMLIAAYDIVQRLGAADEARIRRELSGNLCRCTGYMGVVAAIKAVMSVTGQTQGLPQAPQFFGAPIAFEPTASPVTARPAAPAAMVDVARKPGWTYVHQSFVIGFPPDVTWAALRDFGRIAPCMPGARITHIAGSEVEGEVAIGFGPIKATFGGRGEVEIDDAARSGRFSGHAGDARGGSKVQGEAVWQLVADADNSRVVVTVGFAMAGPLAQFSRSDLVQDFAAYLTRAFAQSLEAMLSGRAAQAAAPSAVSLFVSFLMMRLKRLFGVSGA